MQSAVIASHSKAWFQGEIRHGAYEHPDNYLSYMIESESAVKSKNVKTFKIFARDVATKTTHWRL
jgi:hypothetical protein